MPVAAVILDLAVGDPNALPHPVRLIGRVLDFLAPLATGGRARFLKGAACTVLVAGAAGAAALTLSKIPYIGVFIALYLAFAGLALGRLLRDARRVRGLLAAGDVEEARKALAMLVSRDVSGMDEPDLRRSLAESVAENVNDAFTAPFFWFVLLGPGGLWVYKAVSTMDSMWGYKTEKWREAGRFPARADDVLAWLPARITAFLMIAAGVALRLDWRAAYDNLLEDARKSESPNAGWPMAAAAWLMGARMGGPTPYFGEITDKPLIGPEGEWADGKLARLDRLALATGLAGALLMAGYVWAMTILRPGA
jgi:adenosylcobinamide-phosphate synthase